MNIKYHIEELNKVIKNLADLLGISIVVFDNNGKSLAVYSSPDDYCSFLQKSAAFRKKCLLSDMSLIEKCKKTKKIQSHFCHAGLCDVAMPIVKNNILTAYVVLGRIRLCESPEKYKFDDSHIKTLYESVTKFSDKQLENLTELLPHIMFDTAITIENNLMAEDITEYIRSNITEELSVKSLCNRYYISKNSLYKIFAEEYNCTVNKFIASIRMDEAKKLLMNTKKPIIRVAEDVGITNYTYFCKLFKKHTGISPSKYRKQS